MSELHDDVAFWLQIIGDAKRTIVCSPELESRVKTQVEARGLAGILTVHATRTWPHDGRALVIDEGALEAAQNQSLVRRPAAAPEGVERFSRQWQRDEWLARSLRLPPNPGAIVRLTGI